MRIEVNEIGNGLVRINAVDSFNVPVSILDEAAKDIMRRRKNGDMGHTCTPRSTWGCGCSQPTPNREPDGIDVHVDRPQRQNYAGNPYLAEKAFNKDMSKYRSLEAIAKSCNWPCKENLHCAPTAQHVAAHANVPQFVGTPVARPTAPRSTWGCDSEKAALREAIGALAAIVERM